MKRIKERLNGLSLNKKIICYSYLVIIPVLLVICGIFVARNFERTRQLSRQTFESQVETLSDSVDLILEDVYELSNYIAVNQEINQILTAAPSEEIKQDARLWQSNDVIQMVVDMMALKGYIKTIAIYPENGVAPFLHCLDYSSYISDLELVRETQSYQDALAKRGRTTWRSVAKYGEDIYYASRTDKLVLYREIYDSTKKHPLGYLILGISTDQIHQICTNMIQDPEETILLFNSEGKELLRQGEIDEELAAELEHSEYLQVNYRERAPYLTIGEYEVYAFQKTISSPIVCKIVPRVTLTDVFAEVMSMPLAILFGLLLGLFPVLVFVSNVVSRPLQDVCVAMGKFRQGDFEQRLDVKTKDEIGEVADCFNRMVVDIRELIEQNYVMELKEKESELATLQAQINPHFLYNTLDALYWQACDAGNEEIAENIYALSQLFRLVLSRGEGIVTVAQEMELVTRYLEVQKMRFGRRMEYEVLLDPEVKDEAIPKLILQPFVENAVVHGIGNSRENCRITVKAGREDGWIGFVIQDTGVGMTEEQLAAVWKKQQEAKGSGYRIGRYAIHNVRERLELKYHGNFILKIESREGKGTRVLIRIPAEQYDRNGEAQE